MLKPHKIRQLLALAIVFSALSLVVTIALKVYWGRRHADTTARIFPTADISLQKIHYTETKKGKKQWDLLADKAEYVKEKETTRLTGVQLVLADYGATGDISLTADRADYRNKTGDVDLSGNIKARSASGMEFSTVSAGYNAARGVITTADPVRFTDGLLSVEGVGMELAIESRRVRIGGGVTAKVTPENRNK